MREFKSRRYQGGFLGDLISGVASYFGGKRANEANSALAAQNRDFQMEMANTAHQREVKDLKAAGLNPILSGTGGHGAATPPGSVARMEDPISPAINTALATRRNRLESENMKQENFNLRETEKLIRENRYKANADAGAATESSNLFARNAEVATAQRAQIEAQTKLLNINRGSAILDYDVRSAEQKGLMDQAKNVSSSAMGYKRIIDLILDTFNPLKGWGLGGTSRRH